MLVCVAIVVKIVSVAGKRVHVFVDEFSSGQASRSRSRDRAHSLAEHVRGQKVVIDIVKVVADNGQVFTCVGGHFDCGLVRIRKVNAENGVAAGSRADIKEQRIARQSHFGDVLPGKQAVLVRNRRCRAAADGYAHELALACSCGEVDVAAVDSQPACLALIKLRCGFIRGSRQRIAINAVLLAAEQSVDRVVDIAVGNGYVFAACRVHRRVLRRGKLLDVRAEKSFASVVKRVARHRHVLRFVLVHSCEARAVVLVQRVAVERILEVHRAAEHRRIQLLLRGIYRELRGVGALVVVRALHDSRHDMLAAVGNAVDVFAVIQISHGAAVGHVAHDCQRMAESVVLYRFVRQRQQSVGDIRLVYHELRVKHKRIVVVFRHRRLYVVSAGVSRLVVFIDHARAALHFAANRHDVFRAVIGHGDVAHGQPREIRLVYYELRVKHKRIVVVFRHRRLYVVSTGVSRLVVFVNHTRALGHFAANHHDVFRAVVGHGDVAHGQPREIRLGMVDRLFRFAARLFGIAAGLFGIAAGLFGIAAWLFGIAAGRTRLFRAGRFVAAARRFGFAASAQSQCHRERQHNRNDGANQFFHFYSSPLGRTLAPPVNLFAAAEIFM